MEQKVQAPGRNFPEVNAFQDSPATADLHTVDLELFAPAQVELPTPAVTVTLQADERFERALTAIGFSEYGARRLARQFAVTFGANTELSPSLLAALLDGRCAIPVGGSKRIRPYLFFGHERSLVEQVAESIGGDALICGPAEVVPHVDFFAETENVGVLSAIATVEQARVALEELSRIRESEICVTIDRQHAALGGVLELICETRRPVRFLVIRSASEQLVVPATGLRLAELLWEEVTPFLRRT